MPYAILTKYRAPTNARSARLSVITSTRRFSVAYDHALNGPANHWHAMREALRRMDKASHITNLAVWSEPDWWHAATMPNDEGSMAWVYMPRMKGELRP